MEHYEFELKEEFSDNDFNEKFEEAKQIIFNKNDLEKDCLQLSSKIINHKVNGCIGVFTKFIIVKDELVIGYLELFKSNDRKYYTIYTSSL
ncbi:hypothetical protein [Flavobacterium beibuense]|uniref:hypothetical protein n=1 Tax=Flavobacterium beibuense TaxID=657326 RepID=UPI003A956191